MRGNSFKTKRLDIKKEDFYRNNEVLKLLQCDMWEGKINPNQIPCILLWSSVIFLLAFIKGLQEC